MAGTVWERVRGAAPMVVASGGMWSAQVAENSLSALEAAIDAGLDVAALDVRACRDGVFVGFRDSGLSRMTAARGPLSMLSHTAATRLQLRQGAGGHAARLTSDYLPLLSEILATARDEIPLILRLGRWIDGDGVAAQVAAAGLADQVLLRLRLGSSADVARAYSLAATYGVGICPSVRLNHASAAAQTDMLLSLEPAMVELRGEDAGFYADEIARLRAAGVAVAVSTARARGLGQDGDLAAMGDPDAVWGRLVDLGVSVIETARPDHLARWRQDRQAA